MGYIANDAIVVTSSIPRDLAKGHEEAMRILSPLVSPIIEAVVNDGGSFFIAPDGSKEGWAESEDWEARRDQFIAWMREQDLYLHWVYVRFGGDFGIEVGSIVRDHRHA